MNPSTEDMLNAIDQVNAETIFIFPNNSNIILAAQQAKDLTENKKIIVIPSKTVPQGITAIINFVHEKSIEENEKRMTEEMKKVKSGQITYAVRDTVIDGKEIKQGDIMGLDEKTILAVGSDISATTFDLIKGLVDEDSELISLYYGEEITEETANELAEQIMEVYPDIDVEVHAGGQPIYYYVLSVE
jgi:dihydroxyacetone kinase-like predicted kinase